MKNEVTNIQTAGFNGAGTVVYAFNSNCRLLAKWNYGVKQIGENIWWISSDCAYRTRAIITRGLYFFYPIFHCGLYCRAVYTAERLVFHDSFLSNQGCIHGCIKGCLFTYKNKLLYKYIHFSLQYFCFLALSLVNRQKYTCIHIIDKDWEKSDQNSWGSYILVRKVDNFWIRSIWSN